MLYCCLCVGVKTEILINFCCRWNHSGCRRQRSVIHAAAGRTCYKETENRRVDFILCLWISCTIHNIYGICNCNKDNMNSSFSINGLSDIKHSFMILITIKSKIILRRFNVSSGQMTRSRPKPHRVLSMNALLKILILQVTMKLDYFYLKNIKR